jgi:Predicted Fe-S-cluster redox enzyme
VLFCFGNGSTESARLYAAELEELCESLGAPRYRGRQIVSWLYAKGATDIAAMSDLPLEFRATLGEQARFNYRRSSGGHPRWTAARSSC